MRPERTQPDVSAVVVNYESGSTLATCLGSIEAQDLAIETIVVDNGSSDGSAAAATGRDVRVISAGRNLGFAGGANLGAEAARGRYLLFLNPDTTLAPGAVAALTAALEDPTVGVVGPALDVVASGTVEYGATLDPFGFPVPLTSPAPPLYVAGCALMTRAQLFRSLGGFDARYFLFVEDVDYCWRVLLRGHDVRVEPTAGASHLGGAAAVGGYLTPDGLRTSRLRVALRERNTLATLLTCYSPAMLAVVAVPYVAQALATAAALRIAGKGATARDVVTALAWNLRHARATLVRRRMVQRTRTRSDREILSRMYRGSRKVRLAIDHGMPWVDER